VLPPVVYHRQRFEATQRRRNGFVLRRAEHVLLPHRPDRLGRNHRRSVRTGFLCVELGSRQTLRRRVDVLVPGRVSEPHRLGRSEVVDFTRKHTANVYEAVADIRGIIARQVETRDAHNWDLSRRDGFVQVVKQAMETRLGSSSDEVLKVLTKQGITRTLAKEAVEVARRHGAVAMPRVGTIFAVVDANAHLQQARQRGRAKRSGPESLGTPVAGQVVIKGSEATHHRASPLRFRPIRAEAAIERTGCSRRPNALTAGA